MRICFFVVSIPEKIVEAERRAKVCGVTVDELCSQAGIARSTWQRWKSGETAPNTRTWERVEAVFSELLQAA